MSHRIPVSIVLTAVLVSAKALIASSPALAAPAKLLRTLSYETPVRAGPDELLLLAGDGLDRNDRVVYEAVGPNAGPEDHPALIPARNAARIGTAAVVRSDGPYSLVVHLPASVQRTESYRLWVVNGRGEWSEPVRINDPRPLWISPAQIFSTVDYAGLHRKLRVVGRNLAPLDSTRLHLRLRGPETYELTGQAGRSASNVVDDYVTEMDLPSHLPPGLYAVSLSRDGHNWVDVPEQRLQVRSDPARPQSFSLDDPVFGNCHPDDGADDSECLDRALSAAGRVGGVVVVPRGIWDVSSARLPVERTRDGFVLQPGVSLEGAESRGSVIVRHDFLRTAHPGALLTVTRDNTINGLVFRDAETVHSPDESRPTVQLGLSYRTPPPAGHPLEAVTDVTITNNLFLPVARAIWSGGRPIARLVITHNEFGAFDNALLLVGDTRNVTQPFRIDDAVIRWNRFEPGSYVDMHERQGTIAAQFGASARMDFSSNIADGASLAALKAPGDPRGWRAAFFWNLNNNQERLLVSDNRITCPGDKAGDGEALAFDGNADTWAFTEVQRVTAAGPDWVRVTGPVRSQQQGQPVDLTTYYKEHWVQVMEGPGVGQTRKIHGYEVQSDGAVTLHVSPAWDVIPVTRSSRIAAGRQFWQTYVIANEIDQRAPLCSKSNVSGPNGGLISLWAQSADVAIEGNHQWDTDGIAFQQLYDAKAASCPTCSGSTAFSTAVEIRGNTIDGEYDWSSDCSHSGILGSFGASPTPKSIPPITGFGPVIADNVITHADALFGGAIDIAPTWHRGPPPQRWPLVQNPLIFHNVIRDIAGPAPRSLCHYGQRQRSGIRLGTNNVHGAVLGGNVCEHVDNPLDDGGKGTLRLCSMRRANSCECGAP